MLNFINLLIFNAQNLFAHEGHGPHITQHPLHELLTPYSTFLIIASITIGGYAFFTMKKNSKN